MHWFWRAIVALGAGTASFFGLSFANGVLMNWLWCNNHQQLNLALHIPSQVLVEVLVCVIATTTYGVLTRRYYAVKARDPETRCRRCDYILRGLSEAQCPECGERV